MARHPAAALLGPLALALGSLSSLAHGFGTEVISDITSPAADEGRALELKADQFWHPILEAADVQDVKRHEALYEDAEVAIAALPAENSYVHQALLEALAHLRRADEAVLAQARRQAELASERLTAALDRGEPGGASTAGGKGLLALALKRLADAGGYHSKLRGHIEERQADVLPVLRGAAAGLGGVLGDCRAASKYGFEVLKYDIYQRGAAKTPEAAKKVADGIVDASAETRRRFMKLTMATVDGIARDAEGQREHPSAVVTRSLLEDMRPLEESAEDGLQINL